MFKNYLTVAIRSLAKNRLYAAINIFGLAVGLASCILIVLFVRDELSYDKWLKDSDRIYRVEVRFDIPGRSPMIGQSSPGPALPALKKDFSEIEAGTWVMRSSPVVKRGADVFREDFLLVEPSFFGVLDLPLAAGDRASALSDVTSVLVSESMARKYFGAASPLGQVLPATFNFGDRDLKVSGVFKDLPTNSHIKADFIGRLNEADYDKNPGVLREWTSTNVLTYVKLKTGADVDAIRRALPAFEKRNVPNFTMGGQDLVVSELMKLSLKKVTDIHLHSEGFNGMKPGGSVATVATFSAIAVMILLIACINFTNLATARASQRAREVALRKVLGAKRRQLIVQFLSESVLTAMIALSVALVMVQGALPSYNSVLDKKLALDFAGAGGLLLAAFALICLVGVVAGLYPALYLSGFMPSRILKANKSAAAEGSGRLRMALVVLQFAMSIGLMVCTAVVYAQTLYAKTTNLGYDQSNLLVVRSNNRPEAERVMDTLRREVVKVPGVRMAALSSDVPADGNSSNGLFEIPGKPSPEPLLLQQRNIDYGFFATYKVPLLAGRALDEDHSGDDTPLKADDRVAHGANIMINSRALRRLGFASPEAAIGQHLNAMAGETPSDKRTMDVTIVGVVGDIYYESVRVDVEPTFFQHLRPFGVMTVRYDGVPGPVVRDAIGKVWHDLAPASPYRVQFMDTMVAEQYRAEDAAFKIFAVFAGLAIVIACLGLYGLAAFTAARSTKEIGIRKVLGARIRDLVRLLVWDFSKPVLIANLIAWPAAWFLMRDWLNGFQFRIDLNPMVFAVAGFAALLIAWVTVAGHAARAARANPIRALRYE